MKYSCMMEFVEKGASMLTHFHGLAQRDELHQPDEIN